MAVAAARTASRAIPGPPKLPLLGNNIQFIQGMVEGIKANKPYKFLRDWHDQYGPVVSVSCFGLGNALFIGDPEIVKYVVRNDPARFTKGSGYDMVKRGWLDNTVVLSEGEAWRRKRDLYNKAFRLGATRSYAPVFESIAKTTAADWRAKHERGEEVDAVHSFESVAFEAIGQAGFGMAGLGSPGHPYAKAFQNYTTVLNEETMSMSMRLLPQWAVKWVTRLRGGAYLEEMLQESRRLVAEASSARASAGQEAHRNLVALMQEALAEEDGLQMDAEQLAREANLFLFAGHDTTSATLSWAVAMLGSHPEVQKKLYDELSALPRDSVLAETADPRNLPYLGAVVKETLRLYPPAPMVIRQTKHEEELGGYRVPPGTNVFPSIWAVHRDPTVFEAPDEFRPERWQDATPDQAKQMQDHWMPFMIGARSCIGQQFSLMETRVVLATLLRDFEVQVVSKPQTVVRVLVTPSNVKLKCTPRPA